MQRLRWKSCNISRILVLDVPPYLPCTVCRWPNPPLLKNSQGPCRWCVGVCTGKRGDEDLGGSLQRSTTSQGFKSATNGPSFKPLSQQESVMWSFAHFQTPGALMWFCFCSPSPRITVMCLAQWGNLFGWWQETRTYKSVIKMHSGIAGVFFYFFKCVN